MFYCNGQPCFRSQIFSIFIFFSFLLFFPLSNTTTAREQFTPRQYIEQTPDQLIHISEVVRHPAPFPVAKRKGFYTKTDWQEVIDQTWRWGRPISERVELLNFFWNSIDQDFACFNNIPDPWYDFRDTYLPEVEAGVSKGRMAGILSHMILGLQEYHTHCWDEDVSWTALAPGVPLINLWARGWVGRFGAGLTPLPDKSLLVYKVKTGDHPYDLVPGDIILGYDGVPWHELYPQLIEAELPISGAVGCSPTAIEHDWLICAGLNWHLFDNIDIIRHQTGQQESLPTIWLNGLVYNCVWSGEQMDIGIEMPDWNNEDLVSYGWFTEGSDRFGYIYLYGFAYDVEQEFVAAVQAMFNQPDLAGLIIDMRFNMGGNMYLSDAALALLFRSDVETIGGSKRYNEHHTSLEVTTVPADSGFESDPNTYWDKPLAILTGPGAISSGDQVALRLKIHPRAKVFGRTTSGAFNDPQYTPIPGWPEMMYGVADGETYYRTPGNYLTHTEFTDHEEVWHTQEAVIAGRDNVVDAATAWIRSEIYDLNDIYVPQQQPTIQAAIDAVSPGAVIHLDDGIYTGPGNRDLDFNGKMATLKSVSNDPTACVIDCQGSESSPHRGFTFASGEGPELVIQGVTIKDGFTAEDGAAVICSGSSPSFRKVIFATNNSTGSGGGLFLTTGSDAVMDSCSFFGNSAETGGGVFCLDSSPVLSNCTFFGNEAQNGGGLASFGSSIPSVSYSLLSFSGSGGAVHVDDSAVPVFSACDIFGNTGGDWSGSIADQLGNNANFSADPLFCDATEANLKPSEFSACAPFDHPERPVGCEDNLIGAWTVCFAEGFIDVTTLLITGQWISRAAAWADYDLDGDPDLYIVNHNDANRLLRNDGDGVFTNATPALLNDSGPGNGAAWADFDNDGDPDLFIANYNQPNLLLRNDGADVFTDVTSFLMPAESAPSVGVSWVDYNNDGLVDLYVVNDADQNILYQNMGEVYEGNFIFVANQELPIGDPGYGRCASWADFNNDGWQDLLLSNDGVNRLIENYGSWGFHLNTSNPFINEYSSSMGSAWADWDNNGLLDLYICKDATYDVLLTASSSNFSLVPEVNDAGVSQGVAWADFDNDGDQDIYLARYYQKDCMYLNTSYGFIKRKIEYSPWYSQAVAWADYDQDGTLDVFISSGSGNKLLRGIPRPENHWLHIRLKGIQSNASGIGTRVRLVAGGKSQIREVAAGSGFLGQNSLEVEFGLGTATVVDSLQIWWPSGVYQTGTGLAVDQLMEIEEEAGATSVLLSDFSLESDSNGVTVNWSILQGLNGGELRLVVTTDNNSREIPYRLDSPGHYSAIDRILPDSGEVFYSLYWRNSGEPWVLLASEKFDFSEVPLQTRLNSVHPNPFNPKTTICFAVDHRQRVQVEIFDLTGRRVAVIADEVFNRGTHETSWLGCDDSGKEVASGTYFLRMTSEANTESRKVMLVR